MNLPTTYLCYLAVSIAVTVWVAHTLHRRGRIFLITNFGGNETLADSVNDLLVVGFYLINLGYVALALRYGVKPTDLGESIEFLSTKIGLVLLILGGMHYCNLWVFSRMGGRQASNRSAGQSPFAPTVSKGYGRSGT